MCMFCHEALHMKVTNDVWFRYGQRRCYEDYLLANPDATYTELGKLTGLSNSNVASACSLYGITHRITNRQFGKYVMDGIPNCAISEYASGDCVYVLSDRYECSVPTVMRFLHSNNVTIRGNKLDKLLWH